MPTNRPLRHAATLALLLALPAAALGQAAIPNASLDAGAATLTGGAFTLRATVAQPSAAAPMTGGAFSLTGGFFAAPACRADYNGNGQRDLLDIFAFLNDWFAGNIRADFNGTNGVELTDIFAFLQAWFAGC